jgi:hypothetical protein
MGIPPYVTQYAMDAYQHGVMVGMNDNVERRTGQKPILSVGEFARAHLDQLNLTGEQLVRTALVQKQASPCLIGEMSIDEKPKRVSRDYDSRCGFTDQQLRPNCGSSVWTFRCG